MNKFSLEVTEIAGSIFFFPVRHSVRPSAYPHTHTGFHRSPYALAQADDTGETHPGGSAA